MSERPQAPRTSDLIAGKYKLERMIGKGGMGTVYAARHVGMNRLFAVKLMASSLSADADAKARFIREARVAGFIDHPAVIRTYDVGSHGASLYIVMDLLEGQTLADRLSAGPIPVEEATHIMLAVLGGVAAAHRTGVVHRDLKPDNIFLCRSSGGATPEPRILDFGVCKAFYPDGGVANPVTAAGMVLGTPLYMSPEQLTSAKDIDHRTDIYSLGAIFYQMITGQVPYKGKSIDALLPEITNAKPQSIVIHAPGLSEAVNDVVIRAMARSPDDRYPDADSFARAINSMRMEGFYANAQRPAEPAEPPRATPSSAGSASGLPRIKTSPSRWARPSIVVGLAALCIAGGALLYAWSTSVVPMRSRTQTGAPAIGGVQAHTSAREVADDRHMSDPAGKTGDAAEAMRRRFEALPKGLEPPKGKAYETLPRARRRDAPVSTSGFHRRTHSPHWWPADDVHVHDGRRERWGGGRQGSNRRGDGTELLDPYSTAEPAKTELLDPYFAAEPATSAPRREQW